MMNCKIANLNENMIIAAVILQFKIKLEKISGLLQDAQ